MGNNKRKASLVVLTIIVAAMAFFPFVADSIFNLDTYAATNKKIEGLSGSISATGHRTNEEYNITMSSGVWMVRYSGQSGAGTGAGQGYSCIAFKNGTSFSAGLGWTDGGKGTGANAGGGAGWVSGMNFAGCGTGKLYAAGGGGGGSTRCWGDYRNASWNGYTLSTKTDSMGYNGAGASQSTGYDSNGATKNVYYGGYWNYATSYGKVSQSGGGIGYKHGQAGQAYTYTPSYSSESANWTQVKDDYFYLRATTFAGGGGACSPGQYPAGNVSGNGSILLYNINPWYYPVSVSGTGNATLNANTLASTYKDSKGVTQRRGYAPDEIYTGFNAAWVYSKDGSTWYTTPAGPNDAFVQKTVGKTTIYCRYVLYGSNTKYSTATAAANDGQFIIASVDRYVQKTTANTFTTKPTVKSVTWNGSAQKIVTNKDKIATTAGSGYRINVYKIGTFNGVTNPLEVSSEDADKIVLTNPGTYHVYAIALGSGSYTTSGNWDTFISTVYVYKADPNLTANTLYSGGNKVFNNSGQYLFGGSCSRSGNGQVYYWVQESSTTAPTGNGNAGCQQSVKNVGTYYLWYRVAEGTNHTAAGWRVLKDANGNAIPAKIDKVGLSATATLMSDCDYNGIEHQLISSVTITNNSDNANIKDYYDIVYTDYASYGNGGENRYYESENYKFSGMAAGKHVLGAKWTLKSNITDRNNFVETGSVTFGTVNIRQIDNKDDKIQVLDLTPKKKLELNFQKLCTPIETSRVDLKVCGIETDNYITDYDTTQDVCDDGLTPVNRLSYCFSQSTTAPADEDFKTTNSPAAMNTAILNATVNNVGTWYLYFRVENHYNLKTGTKFVGCEFTVGGMVITNNELNGIRMTGANENKPKEGSVTYNGSPYTLVTDTTVKLGSTVATFGVVQYALGTSATLVPSSGWKDSLADLSTVTEYGTYYLWVRWDEKGDVAENAGTLYGQLEIKKYNAVNDNTYFSGHDFKTIWGEPETSGALQYYSQVFKNGEYQLGTLTKSTMQAIVKGASGISTSEFGTFYFALVEDTEKIPNDWKRIENFDQLKIKNVDDYYLRVKWDGGKNIESTSSGLIYRYVVQGTNTVCKPVFRIKTLEDNTTVSTNSNIKLAHQKFARSIGSSFYHYEDISGYATSKAQSVFMYGNEALQININDAAYILPNSKQIYYLVSTEDDISKISPSSPNWKLNIEDATIKNAGVYHLWVKVVAKDANIDIVRVYKFKGENGNLSTCTVQKAAAYVEHLPSIQTGLKYTSRPQCLLKTDSIQTSPEVEYSLDNGETWISDYLEVKATTEGDHVILCRGVAVDTDNFVDQTSDFRRITVTIQPSSDQDTYYAEYSFATSSNGVVYTGHPISTNQLFNIGYGQVWDAEKEELNTQIPLLYKWETDNKWYTYGELPRKTNVGTYKCLYKPDDTGYIDSFRGAKEQSVTVQITKANISVGSLYISSNDLAYKGADYELLLQPMDYGMVGTNETLTNTNNVPLTYKNYLQLNTNLLAGKMGTLYYGVSTNNNITPSEWKTDYTQIKARTVGNYYIWTKVEEGDNHKASSTKCHNISNPIKIVPVDINVSGYIYNNFYVDKSTYSSLPDLRYTGLLQALISNFTLNMEFADRNNEGEVLKTDGLNIADSLTERSEIKYNTYNNTDYLGTRYYAIVKKGANYPADDDYTENHGWNKNFDAIAKIDAAIYDLCLRFVPDNNSNIKTDVKFRISAMSTLDGSERDKICIAPANKDDLVLSGYFKDNKMYNGHPQIISQTNNGLNVTHKTSYVTFTDEYNNQILEQKYCYVLSGELPPTLDSNWTDFNNAKVDKVGKYQLWVKLVTTSNIDMTVPLIYPLLGDDNYAEITLVNESGVTVVNPVYINDLVYNGRDQNLISQPACLIMSNGTTMAGKKGAITYYISSSSTTIDKTGTTKNGQAYSVDNVKELHAGTYYIWAQFAQGDSHTAMGPFYVGSVSIAQATHENIGLSNLQFTTNTYDGEEHALIDTTVIQTFINRGKILNSTDDYAKIEYAYSNNPEGLEGGTVWYEEANLNQFKGRDAGKYYIWLRVTGKVNDVTEVKDVVDFIKCYSIDEYALIERATLINKNIEGVLFHRDLVYIAQPQKLASIPNKLKLILSETETDLNNSTYNNDLSINWGVSDSSETEPTVWYTTIDSIEATDHDDYYLWIWIPESKNINKHKDCFEVITIDKATLCFIQEPGIYTDLVYNGNYQNLLSSAPIIKYYAYGKHYDPDVKYYDANGVYAEYRNKTTGSVWSSNLLDMQGLNAVTYEVLYRVPEAANWKSVESEIYITIKPVDASTENVALVEAPRAYVDLAYNEKEQDLVFFGLLSDNLPVAGCGAALEGCQIVFYYADDERETQYKYYYDVVTEKYVWDWEGNGKLPGRVNVGDYHIRYFITDSTKTGNFKASAVSDLYIRIERREVYWEVRPEANYGLKFTNNQQSIIVAGKLNVGETNPCSAKGVYIKYTLDDPSVPNRNWQDEIPVVNQPDLWYVWYRIEVDKNNIFVGAENNDPAMGEMIVVLIERHVLAIRDLPRPYETIQYTAEEQSLIEYYFLSTDDVRELGENAPYFEYSFSKYASDEDWVRDIKAKDVGEYTVYYRLYYNDNLFEFRGDNDGREEPMELVVEIKPVKLNPDSIHAVYIDDENGGYLTYETDQYRMLDPETEEWEYYPMYSDVLLEELEGYMQYFYRKGDQYTQDVGWLPWGEGANVKDLGIGSYQFMVRIVGGDGANFEDYAQNGYSKAFNAYTNTEDRVIEVIMKDYNTPAYVRAWIDFTTTMTYEEAEFKFEGWVDKNGRLEIPFYEVNSTGRYNGAVIRMQTLNASYYYMSQDALSKESKSQIELKASEVKNAIKSFNTGLINPYMTVYFYEVYRIQYDANGGIGDNLSEGWKWHKIDYLLAENKFSKTENGEVLVANGWNTSKAGNGTNYSSGAMYYRDDASQIFYAKFFASGDNYYTIKWIIDNGSKRYALSRDFGVWFDTANEQYQSRDTGILVAEGELITLPQIQVDENGKSLSGIFGGYILGWYTEEENIPYSIGMTATRNVTFVAELNYDLNSYVQCKFIDEENEEIHDSGLIANGAQAYMALSGMDINLINDYREGYEDWVEQYGFEYLDSSNTPDGVLQFNLGVKEVVDSETKKENQITWDDYISMFVILGLGVATTVISLSVYIIMRKKHKRAI